MSQNQEPQKQENQHIILLLAANPKDTDPLRLDEEVREITEGLIRSKKRDYFKLTQKWAVRGRDLQRAMLETSPQIIHFSGHGTGEEGLVLENETGQTQFVDAEALANLFQLFNEQLDCVVLNACYSEVQAKAIAKHIKYVIGMNQAIGDKAAIEFAVGFYDAIGAGKSIEFAYKLGCSAIRIAGISEDNTPKLITKNDSEIKKYNPDEVTIKDINERNQLEKEEKNLKRDLSISPENVQKNIAFDNIETTHIRWKLVLEAEINYLDETSLEHIIFYLKELLKDPSLTLEEVKDGSVQLIIVSTKEAYQVIYELFNSSELTTILEFNVVNLQKISNNEFILKQVNEAIDKAIGYLKITQRKSGSWGDEANAYFSSPQNTGEALVALMQNDYDNDRKDIKNSIYEGIKYLLDKDRRCDDGGWPKGRREEGEPKISKTIATSWALIALTLYKSKYEVSSDHFKEVYLAAQNFLIDITKRRKEKGSWADHQHGKSSVTATCYAIISLLASQKYTQEHRQKSETNSIVIQGFQWLGRVQNNDGGFGFFLLDDPSKRSVSILVAITLLFARRHGIKDIPEKLNRTVRLIQSEIQEELYLYQESDVEYEYYKTVNRQYEHFTLARLIYLLFDNDLQVKYEILLQSINLLLEMQAPNGGFKPRYNGYLWTWSTSQAIIALCIARNWLAKQQVSETDLDSEPNLESENSLISASPQVTFEARKIINLLHLSDLHFGTEVLDSQRWSNQLAQDLSYELKCSTLDCIIISGDVANKSIPKEYFAATQFFNSICQEFEVEPEQLIIVPGNHDVNWSISKKCYRFLRKEDCSQEQLKDGMYIDRGNGIFEVQLEDYYPNRFEHFNDFYQQVIGKPYPKKYDQQGVLHHFPELNLLILSLNSAWNLDYYFTDRVTIYPPALFNALTEIRRNPDYTNCLKIAVWHHGLSSNSDDYLKDKGILEQLAQAGFRFVLHGHVHTAETNFYRYDHNVDGRKLDIIGAGTFGAPSQELVPGYPWQYNLLKFEGNQLTVHTRRREAVNGTWKPDARWTQGAGKNPLPYYTIDI